MAVWLIGDLQGCHDELLRLLDKLRFDPASDQLRFTGDLVARGPRSLEVLREIRALGDAAVAVLGNHDLHLLAVARGVRKPHARDRLDAVLAAPDRDELLDWLRRRPLIHDDPALGVTLLHAGLPPQWSIADAVACADEVERVLAGDGYGEFLDRMYGDRPERWSDDLTGLDRLRFITNCLTRLRYCDGDGRLALDDKGPPGTQREGCMPWFDVPGRKSADARIACGHWSTLGFVLRPDLIALDTGCLWGGALTAVRIDGERPQRVSLTCPEVQKPQGFL